MYDNAKKFIENFIENSGDEYLHPLAPAFGPPCLIPVQSNSSMHHYECVALCKDISLQRGRFCARSLASCIPRSCEDRSSLMFFIQVVRGRPGGRLQFSGGGSKMAWLASAFSSIRARCPKKVRRRTKALSELLLIVVVEGVSPRKQDARSVVRKTSSNKSNSANESSAILVDRAVYRALNLGQGLVKVDRRSSSCATRHSAASTRVQGWGDEPPNGVWCGRGTPVL